MTGTPVLYWWCGTSGTTTHTWPGPPEPSDAYEANRNARLDGNRCGPYSLCSIEETPCGWYWLIPAELPHHEDYDDA